MSTTVYQQGGYGTAPLFPNPIIAQRDPASSDIVSPSGLPYQIMQGWNNELTDDNFIYLGAGNWATIASVVGSVNELTGNSGGAVLPTAGNINVLGNNTLGINATGSGSTLTVAGIQGSVTQVGVWEGATAAETGALTDATRAVTPAGLEPILATPYVVAPGGAYTTIQSALDAATASGGGTVYVRPGTYTEDLTLYENVNIVGAVGNSDAGTSGNTVVIVGVHTPSISAGSFSIVNCRLESATHIFSSAGAGACSLILENCFVAITNGFLFDLTNWTGDLVVYNLGDGSTNNGVVNNSGGATCFFVSATLGAGTGQTMVTSGTVNMQEIDLQCPWNAQTGTVIEALYVSFSSAITLSNDSSGSFNFCKWSTGAAAAITMSSTGAIQVANSVIESSNTPAIDGAGAGVLSLGDLTFADDDAVAATLTVTNLPFLTGKLRTVTGGAADSAGVTAAMTGTPGSVTVATTAVTADSIILISRNTPGGTLGNLSVPTGSIIAGTSFDIDSDANETSTINWMIIN